ncbi:MAG TPA: ADP-ribosylglycohydrolase family protein [Desulfuromonadales bacterium]|nr:ADP-ribosylglycohydrolase family protein [Desulfuromonadales bacterium]
MERNTPEHFTGCLLGGAVGDALGWPVEFLDYSQIVKEYGPAGITEMVPGEDELYEITDDTQMTLFTAEGLLQAWSSSRHYGSPPDFAAAVKHSYYNWLKTQGEEDTGDSIPDSYRDGWLITVEGLHRRRAPGSTCLTALREGDYSDNGIVNNNSKGCGGVMRAAPAGLLAARINNGSSANTARLAFEIGCTSAALTHGHPSGYYPAGVLAAVIATIVTGGSLKEGIDIGLSILEGRIGAAETVNSIRAALDLRRNQEITPSPAVVETLGGGWTGEEALAISLYCALVAENDFMRGVQLAVNHSGDSDSTGSITGNILGALLGSAAIPENWLAQMELVGEISRIGEDLYTAFGGTEQWVRDYPPFA